jgi:septum formation topological specificity factor MinE
MIKLNKHTPIEKNTSIPPTSATSEYHRTDDIKKQFKKELLDVFKKFGYIEEDKDYEVKFKTTSGNIAWININRIEIIK